MTKPNIYYRIEERHPKYFKKWRRVIGYVGFDLDRMRLELEYFRGSAMLRGQTRGNEYRLVKVNKKTHEEEILPD